MKTITVTGYVLLAALVFVIGFLSVQMQELNSKFETLDTKFETIRKTLTLEFRAMRTEMTAQTTAISAAITATRKVQPPTAPPTLAGFPTAAQPMGEAMTR